MTRIVTWLMALAITGCGPALPSEPARPALLDSADAIFEHGRALGRHGDSVRAEQYMTMAVRAGYPRTRAVLPLVRVCIAGSRLRAALGHARPYLQQHPEDWRLRFVVAALELALGRSDRARDELLRVLAAQPQAADAHYLLAVLHRDTLGDEPAARAGFRSYLRHDPDGRFAAEARSFLDEHETHSVPVSERASVPIIAHDSPLATGAAR